MKLSAGKFIVVATDTAHRHVESHMARHTDDDASVVVTDVTASYTQLNIQGPNSRAMMQALTDTDMSDQAFPFREVGELQSKFQLFSECYIENAEIMQNFP